MLFVKVFLSTLAGELVKNSCYDFSKFGHQKFNNATSLELNLQVLR